MKREQAREIAKQLVIDAYGPPCKAVDLHCPGCAAWNMYRYLFDWDDPLGADDKKWWQRKLGSRK